MDTYKHKTLLKFSPFNTSEPQYKYSKEVLINEKDIVNQLFDTCNENKFLGVFSQKGVLSALEDHRILPALRKKGVQNIIFRMDPHDPLEHKFQIYFDQPVEECLLVELVLHKTCLPSDRLLTGFTRRNKLEMLYIEWLLLQNPTREFDAHRPRLPGQKYPGLGLAKELLRLLLFFGKTLKSSGIVAVPGHFHTAAIFSKGFQYLNPELEGKLKALQRDFT